MSARINNNCSFCKENSDNLRRIQILENPILQNSYSRKVYDSVKRGTTKSCRSISKDICEKCLAILLTPEELKDFVNPQPKEGVDTT